MIIKNKWGRQFLEFIPATEADLMKYHPLGGSFAVIKCRDDFLICYNSLRKQWELPAGKREKDETPHECALRELFEETGQRLTNLNFKGLLKMRNQNNSIHYNPVYSQTVFTLHPFIENTETNGILLWDGKKEIGPIDEVDMELLKYI